MHLNETVDTSFQQRLHAKIRSRARRIERESRVMFAEILCDRLNALRTKSDIELRSLGLRREEIGAQVLEELFT